MGKRYGMRQSPSSSPRNCQASPEAKPVERAPATISWLKARRTTISVRLLTDAGRNCGGGFAEDGCEPGQGTGAAGSDLFCLGQGSRLPESNRGPTHYEED